MGRALAIGKLNKFRIFMKRALSVICVTVILIIGLCYCNQLFIRKDSYRQCEPFYNSSQEFDVLLFGSSHVWNGISPLLLYRDYGITSYNLAAPGNYIPSNYYRLQEILKFLKRENRQLPKVIVLDVFAGKDSAYWLHLGWDDFSFSANKIKMVDALLDEKDRAAMMFPFFLYHSRWNELGKDDFRTDTNKFYGMARGNYELSYPEKEIISDPSDRTSADAETVGYLEQIKEECEAAGIKLILIHIPYSYRPDLQRTANGICQYADEQGILCVNYMNMDIELDHEIDFCDPGHLNPTGMRIMTDELGKLLTGAGVEDHRGGAQSAQWEQACEEYIDFRVEKIKNIWLLAASYYFYMGWNAKYIVLLLFTTLVTYSGSLALERHRKKWILFLTIALNFGILFFFKYVQFAWNNLGYICRKLGIPFLEHKFDILLPVGISFFTFQAVGYVIDVYRKEIYAERNLLRYALFVSFFPQLVAGPIERSKNLLKQLDRTYTYSYERMREGLLLMLWGFFLKLVIADRAAIFVDAVFADTNKFAGLYVVAAAIIFAFQIYCDFYGYSVIAMGSARIIGLELMDNFNAPYFSKSVSEFWRRWHISLSTWFRDYLYIPLGGSRKGRARNCLNLMLVFLTSGLWHGSAWTFVTWGRLSENSKVSFESGGHFQNMQHYGKQCGVRR